jgi:hypothetical protein
MIVCEDSNHVYGPCRFSLISIVTAFQAEFIFNLYRDFALIRLSLNLGATCPDC